MQCNSLQKSWRMDVHSSGRQLCDAVSLTGKPCTHQRHDVEASESLPGVPMKQHSSGYVFLHACSCGRSWKLRSNPFDFESANITFNCFPDCNKHLPTLQLPEASCLPPSIPECEQKLQFNLRSQVVFPAGSFVTLRLPFVYGVQLEDGSLHSLSCFEHQPEVTSWITKGTTLQVMSKRNCDAQDGVLT